MFCYGDIIVDIVLLKHSNFEIGPSFSLFDLFFAIKNCTTLKTRNVLQSKLQDFSSKMLLLNFTGLSDKICDRKYRIISKNTATQKVKSIGPSRN